MESVDIQLLKVLENPKVSLEELENAISNGADINAEAEDGTTPIIVAAHFCEDVNIIKKLLELGADINARTISYENFIMRKAVRKQDISNLDPDNIPDKIINKIHNEFNAILNSPEGRYTDGAIVEGSALLYAAKYNNNVSIIECLLNKGADINVVDEEGKNALMFAAQYNTNPQIIKLLIEKYGKDAELDAALYLACANNPSFDVFRCLIDAGANTNIVWDGESLVYIASHNHNAKILAEIMKLDKRVDWSNKKNLTKLLLYLVDSWDYNIDVIKFLIENGADANATTQSGESILEQILNHTTIDGVKDKGIIKFLIDSGAKVDSSMLHWVADATKLGPNELLEPLAQKCDDIADVFLYLIENTTNVNLIENLITSGIDPNVELKTKYRTELPIVAAAKYNRSPDIIECLIWHGANPNYTTKTGRTLLMDAVQNNSNPAVIERFIACGADVNAKGYIKTALIYAVNRKIYSEEDKKVRLEIINILLKSGAEVNAIDSEGNTALIYAVKNRDIDTIKLLLNYNADVNVYNKQGQNATSFIRTEDIKLHSLLAQYASENINLDNRIAQAEEESELKMLFRDPVSKEVLDSALFKALPNNRNPNVIKSIIEHGANINTVANESNSLLLAVKNKNSQVVDLLIKMGCDVNAKDKRHKSVLMTAVESNAPIETMQCLLDAGADVNARDKNWKTALYYASSNINITFDVFKLLMDYGADPKIRSKTGHSPLSELMAIRTSDRKEFAPYAKPCLEKIEILLKAGVDVNTLLISAVNADDIELAKLLLDNGADVHITSYHGSSMHSLARSRDMKNLLTKYE